MNKDRIIQTKNTQNATYLFYSYNFIVYLPSYNIKTYLMKKILLLMGALGLFNYAQAQTSETQTFIYDELEYTVTGENTVGLSDACDLPEVIIPETVTYEGKTYTVTSIMDHSFNYNDVTTKVVMPNTITEIEYCGMYGAKAVTEMQISENLTKLGDYAFAYMESIPSITIPDGVTEIPGS